MRIIAESPAEDLHDTRNVLGQLSGSEDSYASAPLEIDIYATWGDLPGSSAGGHSGIVHVLVLEPANRGRGRGTSTIAEQGLKRNMRTRQ